MHKPTKNEVADAPAEEYGRGVLAVANEVWIATALLHREHPEQSDFSVAEIVARAKQEAGARPLRGSVNVHVNHHCVANRPPNPARLRMLVETRRGRRRLYRSGDPSHPGRKGAKVVPARDELPPRYHALLDWYAREYDKGAGDAREKDPLLSLVGLGREIWKDESADDYVDRLREGWA